MIRLRFACPSCGKRFTAIEAMDAATQVVRRTCRATDCRETWQLIVKKIGEGNGARFDVAEFTFIERRPGRFGAVGDLVIDSDSYCRAK